MSKLNALCAALGLVLAVSATPVLAEGVDELPVPIQQQLYNKAHIDPMQPVGPSAYRDWKPKHGAPWTIGYASSYSGNTWRAAVMERLQKVLIPKWEKLGLISKVIITQSNLNDSLQIQQMRQLVSRGVDAIIVCCSNPTALAPSVKFAYDRGVPVFSATGYLNSPYSVNSSANFVVGGDMMAQSMANQIHGKGDVIVVEGIPGASASDSQNLGILTTLKTYPNVSVAGSVTGMWTDQVAQAAIQNWLATNPGQIDGIIIQSASELGALRSLEQSGRPMVPITIGGELGALCYWRKHPDYISSSIQAWPPGDDFEMAWNIMMRTLEGQGPKIESILTKPVAIDYKQVETALPADCNDNSPEWYEVGIENWAGKTYLDNFFLRPAAPEAYKP
jgi:ribose transport system substrate-binding protein